MDQNKEVTTIEIITEVKRHFKNIDKVTFFENIASCHPDSKYKKYFEQKAKNAEKQLKEKENIIIEYLIYISEYGENPKIKELSKKLLELLNVNIKREQKYILFSNKMRYVGEGLGVIEYLKYLYNRNDNQEIREISIELLNEIRDNKTEKLEKDTLLC